MNSIPEELRALNRWHNWRDVNGTKIPIQPNGAAAKSNDPATWTDFQTAAAFGLLAFELGDPYCGIDLDNCIDEDDNLRQWAWKIIDRFEGVAYAEISPSKRGIKLITRGRKPAGSRCVYKVGEDKQQIECYDKTRFWTITGEVYNRQVTIADGQAAVDWICKTYLMVTAKEPKQPQPQMQSGSEIERYAAAYLDSVPAAGPGNRNNSAFKISGHLRALQTNDGAKLTEDQVLEFVRQWNGKSPEPLDDAELQKAVASSAKNGTARPSKLPRLRVMLSGEESENPVNLEGILNQNCPKDFPKEILQAQGFLGEVIDYNLSTALYPLPELAVAGALALLSTITGGKVEGLRARTNVYVMGLAPSGGGKDYSRQINRKILIQAGHNHLCGPERIGSHAGIISALAENWNTLFQIDEIGRLLATMHNAKTSPHLYNIASVLMQIYSSANTIWQADAYGDRKKVKTLNYPHCVVYGTSVPDGFWENLTKENLQEGLIGRFLVFEEPKYVDFRDVDELDIPSAIVERAQQWLEFRPSSGNLAGMDGANPKKVDATPDAKERLTKHAIQISERRKQEAPVDAAIWSRHHEKTNKIALLLACSRGVVPWPVITLQDADAAIALNNWLTRRMLKQAGQYVSDSQFEADQLEVLRFIRDRRECTLTDIARRFRKHKQRDRTEILNTLVESGAVHSEQRETDGRCAVVIRPV